MVTKLKKFNYSTSSKIICFLISCVLLVVSMASVCFLVSRYEKDNGAYIDAKNGNEKKEDITETIAFSSTISKHVQAIMLKSLVFKDGTLETFKKTANDLIEYVQNIIVFEWPEFKSSYSEYVCYPFVTLKEYCDGEISTTTYSDDSNSIVYETTEGKIIELPSDAVCLCDDFSSYKIYSVKFDDNAMYNYIAEILYKRFSEEYDKNEKIFKNIKNLQYAIINETDKTYYTNTPVQTENGKTPSKNDLISYFENFSLNTSDRSYSGSINRNYESVDDDLDPWDFKQVINRQKSDLGYYSIDFQDILEQNEIIDRDSDNWGNYWGNCGLSISSVQFDDPQPVGVSKSVYELYIAFDAKDLSYGNDDYSIIPQRISSARRHIVITVAICIISIISMIYAFVRLIVTAGKKDKNGKVKTIKTDRIPFEFHLIFNASIVCTCVFLIIKFITDYIDRQFAHSAVFLAVICCVLTLVCFCALTEWLMSFARLIKSKTLSENTLIGKVFSYGLSKPGDNRITKKRFVFFIIIAVLLFLPAFAIVFLTIPTLGVGFRFGIISALYVILLFALLILPAKYITKLISAFDNNISINAEDYPTWLRPLAWHIETLQKSKDEAVEAAIKDQKTKTELITNVSHDLKTPLTSVISYADLLSKCDIEDEQAKEYIGVITEKSARLKKLIEDLTEAAKASSGNIEAHIMPLNLNEIVKQIAGEMDDLLKIKKLETVLNLPKEPVLANGDGKLTYRVLENLMSNVQKYAMPNTRVYVSVNEDKSISINNVSEKALNISPEELKARFVRGDESRTTEGSGLGLAIANDLCKIQGGRMDISIDGDFFKVTVRFEVQENKNSN